MNRMSRRVFYGQLTALAGCVLLLVFVPFMPRGWGLPRERVAEMCVFWVGECLLLFGLNASLEALVQDHHGGGRAGALHLFGVLAAGSGVFGTLSCLLTLSILLTTSLDGAGIIGDLDIFTGMPKAVGYLISLPLLPMFICQLLLLGFSGAPAVESRPAPSRAALPFLRVMLFFAILLFAGACFLFLANRWFAVLAVAATWLAQWLFVAMSIELLAYLTRELPGSVEMQPGDRPIDVRRW
jgi:hypothetical protein